MEKYSQNLTAKEIALIEIAKSLIKAGHSYYEVPRKAKAIVNELFNEE